MRLKIEGLDVFGGNKPRSLFARIAPCAALYKLQEDIERICQRLHLPADGRKFTPHVTLARLHDISAEAAARYLSNYGSVNIAPFIVKEFKLLSSRGSIGGGPYITEESYVFDQRIDVEMNRQDE